MPTFWKVVCKSGLLSFCLIEPLGKCERDKESPSRLDQAASLAKLDDAAEPRGSLQSRAVFLFSFFAFYDIVR